MLSKMDGPYKHNTDMIFLDTLFHFDETYALVDRIRKRYNTPVHIYKPAGCDTVADFNARYGEKLWETNEDHYDYVAKVEPAERAYAELQVKAAITGRRRSQGGNGQSCAGSRWHGTRLVLRPAPRVSGGTCSQSQAAARGPT